MNAPKSSNMIQLALPHAPDLIGVEALPHVVLDQANALQDLGFNTH